MRDEFASTTFLTIAIFGVVLLCAGLLSCFQFNENRQSEVFDTDSNKRRAVHPFTARPFESPMSPQPDTMISVTG